MMDTLKAQKIIEQACYILKDSKKHRSKKKSQTVILRPKTAVQHYDYLDQQSDDEGVQKCRIGDCGGRRAQVRDDRSLSSAAAADYSKCWARPKTMSTSIRGGCIACSSNIQNNNCYTDHWKGIFQDSFQDSSKTCGSGSSKSNKNSQRHCPHHHPQRIRNAMGVHLGIDDSDVDLSEQQQFCSRPQTTHPCFLHENKQTNCCYWPLPSSGCELAEDEPNDLARSLKNKIMHRQRSECVIESCKRAGSDRRTFSCHNPDQQHEDSFWANFLNSCNNPKKRDSSIGGGGSGSSNSEPFCCLGRVIQMDDFKLTPSRHHHHVGIPKYMRQPGGPAQEMKYQQEQLLAPRRFHKNVILPGAENSNNHNCIGVRQPRF